MRERLEQVGPLMIIGLHWEFLEPEAVLADIEAAITADADADPLLEVAAE